jgi:molybdenum cofactor cytidylyltransferase
VESSVEQQPSFRSFAVIPAAGLGRRMGGSKLLLPWGGTTLVEHVLGVWRASRVTAVVIVVRPGDDALAKVARRADVDVVVPETAPAEMKHSVQRGVTYLRERYAPQPQDVWMMAPADVPLISSHLIDALLASHRPDSPTIIVPAIQSQRGHPVLFPWERARDVEDLAEDEGVNALSKRFPSRTLAWDDAAILSDVDTPDDYRRLQP